MALREKTVIDHKKRINNALLFIQKNIGKPLSLKAIADVACFSPFHFHRLFQAYMGESLSSHIRRVRLEQAALKLRRTKEPITSIALDAGYETPAAFAKAFRQHFKRSPSDFKKAAVLEFQSLLLDITVIDKEVKTMEHEIRNLPEQRVLFVRKTGRYDKAASEAWGALMKFAYSQRLIGKETKFFGISNDDPEITPEDRIRYDACLTFEGNAEPEGEVASQAIKGGRYAVFLHKGPYEKLGETYNKIFKEWLPSSGEELRDAPPFDVYLNRDPRRTKPENLRTEIHVPIK